MNSSSQTESSGMLTLISSSSSPSHLFGAVSADAVADVTAVVAAAVLTSDGFAADFSIQIEWNTN